MSQFPAILYVEDDPESRMVMHLLLVEHMGLEQVTIFENSQNFKAKIDALPVMPDLIFLDIHVKPYSGFEMLKILRQQPRFARTPIVALTASVMNEEVVQLRTSGFSGVVGKPIDVDTFPETMQRILNGQDIWRI